MAEYVPPPYSATKADWKTQRRAFKTQARLQRQQTRMQMRAMRRNSIFGPLLLLAAGVVFLLAQIGKIRWFTAITWFGKWWPLLLVLAGIILLLEWMYDQHVQEQRFAAGLPARGTRSLGAGTVWLLILVALLGSTARWAGHAWFWNSEDFRFNLGDFNRVLGEAHDSDAELVQPIPADGSLTVDNGRGDVSISGTSDDGKIHVAMHRQVYAMDDSAATQKAQALQPTVVADAGRLTMTIPEVEGGHADVTLEVPRTISVTVSADRGDVHISGIHAPVVVNGNRGSIDLGGLDGTATAHLRSAHATFSAHSIRGGVTLDGRSGDLNVADVQGPVSLTGDFFGSTHLERVNGPVHFHTSRTDFQMERLDGEMELDTGSDLRADQILGPVILATRQRNITLDRVQGAIQIRNRDGSVNVTSAAPLATVEIENHHGSVELGVPPTAGFVVQAATSNGDIENDFNLSRQGQDSHPELRGTVGAGGPLVHIQTSEGDVILRHSSVMPLPRTPPSPPTITRVPPLPAAPEPPAVPAIKVPKVPRTPAPPHIPAPADTL